MIVNNSLTLSIKSNSVSDVSKEDGLLVSISDDLPVLGSPANPSVAGVSMILSWHVSLLSADLLGIPFCALSDSV